MTRTTARMVTSDSWSYVSSCLLGNWFVISMICAYVAYNSWLWRDTVVLGGIGLAYALTTVAVLSLVRLNRWVIRRGWHCIITGEFKGVIDGLGQGITVARQRQLRRGQALRGWSRRTRLQEL